MGDQPKNFDHDTPYNLEESAVYAARRAMKRLMDREVLAKLQRKLAEDRRRGRRFVLNSDLLEINGKPDRGGKIIDLSVNGARLELPFAGRFMSQMSITFSLGEADKIFKVVGRVIWSKMTLQRGRYEIGIQFYQNYWEIERLLRLEAR